MALIVCITPARPAGVPDKSCNDPIPLVGIVFVDPVCEDHAGVFFVSYGPCPTGGADVLPLEGEIASLT